MFADIVRDVLDLQQQQLDHWLTTQAAALGLSVEELAERYTLEAAPIELGYDEAGGTFWAEQNYRLRPARDEVEGDR